jgi:Cu(I)/Ag(I) efflux system membrane fusion protein
LLEIDADTLKVGMKARLLGPNGASAGARVTGFDGSEDPVTHSFGATLRTISPAPWLRPGLFCQVLVDAGLGRRLAVPQEAVLDTGERQVVFVESVHGRFEPRLVILGEAGDDLVEIKHGLKAGEQVVTSANFLIDSESRFRAALNQFQRGMP